MNKSKLAAAGENVIDPKFFDQVAQIAHFFTTYALVLTGGQVFWMGGYARWRGAMHWLCRYP
jgi:hypothetical protein